MTSETTDRFWELYKGLPEHVREQARVAYKRFAANPLHPGLHFKRVHPTRLVYSVRISRDYRALGVLDGDTITWDWIGSHSDYNRLVGEL